MQWTVDDKAGIASLAECPRYQIVKFSLRSRALYVPVVRHPKSDKPHERAKMDPRNAFSPQWLGRGEESPGPARKICEEHYMAHK